MLAENALLQTTDSSSSSAAGLAGGHRPDENLSSSQLWVVKHGVSPELCAANACASGTHLL